MNLVDILIWLILAGFVYKGFVRGLVRQICSLAGFLLGGWAAIKYHAPFADASRHLIHLPHQAATLLSFIFIFLLVGLLFFLLGHILTVILKIILMGGLNRVGGVALGFLEGAFIVCMVLYVAASKPSPVKFREYIARAKTAAPFLEAGREIVAGWGGLPALMQSVPGVSRAKPAGASKD